VIYLDLNSLKQLKDTRGHTLGDYAILKVAKILACKVRSSDVGGAGSALEGADKAMYAYKIRSWKEPVLGFH
jgi:predicted signal transduction protein with EAL and GGDEF domain